MEAAFSRGSGCTLACRPILEIVFGLKVHVGQHEGIRPSLSQPSTFQFICSYVGGIAVDRDLARGRVRLSFSAMLPRVRKKWDEPSAAIDGPGPLNKTM